MCVSFVTMFYFTVKLMINFNCNFAHEFIKIFGVDLDSNARPSDSVAIGQSTRQIICSKHGTNERERDRMSSVLFPVRRADWSPGFSNLSRLISHSIPD